MCRKPVILGGFLLAAVTDYPLYSWLGAVAQPGNVNYPVAIIIVAIMVAYVGLVYGPIGAFLAEYFPGRIRYTSVSVPYHIGNGWGGGLVPFITTAAYTATGSLAYALIYPIAVPAICFVLSLFRCRKRVSGASGKNRRRRKPSRPFTRTSDVRGLFRPRMFLMRNFVRRFPRLVALQSRPETGHGARPLTHCGAPTLASCDVAIWLVCRVL